MSGAWNGERREAYAGKRRAGRLVNQPRGTQRRQMIQRDEEIR